MPGNQNSAALPISVGQQALRQSVWMETNGSMFVFPPPKNPSKPSEAQELFWLPQFRDDEKRGP